MISTKNQNIMNPDGSIKTVFNPADFTKTLETDLLGYAKLSKDNTFLGNNTFTNINALSTVTSPNITTLTSNVSTVTTNVSTLTTNVNALTTNVNTLTTLISQYNNVLVLTAASTTISVATEIPNVIFADISTGSKTVYLPTLSTTYPRNYNGRTFVVHCHDNASSSGNSLTIRSGSSSQYMNQFGTNISTGRTLTPGSVQRYYTMNGLYFEI